MFLSVPGHNSNPVDSHTAVWTCQLIRTNQKCCFSCCTSSQRTQTTDIGILTYWNRTVRQQDDQFASDWMLQSWGNTLYWIAIKNMFLCYAGLNEIAGNAWLLNTDHRPLTLRASMFVYWYVTRALNCVQICIFRLRKCWTSFYEIWCWRVYIKMFWAN